MPFRTLKLLRTLSALTLVLMLGAWVTAWGGACLHDQTKGPDHCQTLDQGVSCASAATCPESALPELGNPVSLGTPAALPAAWRHYLLPEQSDPAPRPAAAQPPPDTPRGALVAADTILLI